MTWFSLLLRVEVSILLLAVMAGVITTAISSDNEPTYTPVDQAVVTTCIGLIVASVGAIGLTVIWGL